jgi:oxygen-dependent protoporphyrinogen oxidase
LASLVIIGAGLTGLAVAVRRARAGDRIVVLEASARPGGQLSTLREEGYVIEEGAEGFVASSEAVPALAREVGCVERIDDQLVERSYGFDGQTLRTLAPGEAGAFLGFQVHKRDLGRGIRAFRGGMGELTDHLLASLGGSVELRFGVAATRVDRDGSGLRVQDSSGVERECEALVVATGAAAAGALLGGLAPEAQELLASPTLSSVTVSLAYRRGAIGHALDGTGFVLSEAAQRDGLRACTFTSSKLPGRAPADRALLRAFFRPTDDDLQQLDDAAWSARASSQLAEILAIGAEPERSWVTRWPHALPIHNPTHAERVKRVEQALSAQRVLLAGSAFHGAGIDAALRSAEEVAARIG